MTFPTDTAQPILSPLTNGTTIINTSPQKADKPPDLARSGPTDDHNIEHRPEDTTETGKYANPQSAASTRVISPSQSLSTPPITSTINQSHATNQSFLLLSPAHIRWATKWELVKQRLTHGNPLNLLLSSPTGHNLRLDYPYVNRSMWLISLPSGLKEPMASLTTFPFFPMNWSLQMKPSFNHTMQIISAELRQCGVTFWVRPMSKHMNWNNCRFSFIAKHRTWNN